MVLPQGLIYVGKSILKFILRKLLEPANMYSIHSYVGNSLQETGGGTEARAILQDACKKTGVTF
jgi:hypothetical protein